MACLLLKTFDIFSCVMGLPVNYNKCPNAEKIKNISLIFHIYAQSLQLMLLLFIWGWLKGEKYESLYTYHAANVVTVSRACHHMQLCHFRLPAVQSLCTKWALPSLMPQFPRELAACAFQDPRYTSVLEYLRLHPSRHWRQICIAYPGPWKRHCLNHVWGRTKAIRWFNTLLNVPSTVCWK